MKTFFLAAALTIAAAGAASAQTDPNGPMVPPGDGITQQGTNPDGMACSPPGFNAGTSSYPPCGGDQHPNVGPNPPTPPPCTKQLKDHCTQTYERGVRNRR